MKDRIEKALDATRQELNRAIALHRPFNSAHEGYAVILEELDELKAEVWKRRGNRDTDRMTKEATQAAAMAIRFILDVCQPHHEPK